ncbi:hypothetical protein CPB86DRAFT_869869 [Serendipita vermifera]|nr:hypothetical protein CPB86DRAFT_869869 [Serendipita vermifera]
MNQPTRNELVERPTLARLHSDDITMNLPHFSYPAAELQRYSSRSNISASPTLAEYLKASPSQSIEGFKLEGPYSQCYTSATTKSASTAPTRYHSFSAAFDASSTRDRHTNERSAAAVMAIFLATLSAALLSYSNDIISNRGFDKMGDPFITGGFMVAISLCMGAALSSYLPTSGLFTSRHMLLLDRLKAKASSRSGRILDGPLHSEAISTSPPKRTTRSLPMLSRVFTHSSPGRLERGSLSQFDAPLTPEELSVIHTFE